MLPYHPNPALPSCRPAAKTRRGSERCHSDWPGPSRPSPIAALLSKPIFDPKDWEAYRTVPLPVTTS
eukprot:765107-Hanusia_phi.AAC.6